jgi:DNA-3-methyladenine glycosylase II
MERLIRVDGPLRLDLALRYLATSPSTISEVVGAASYERAFRTPTGPAVVRVAAADGGVRVSVTGADALEQGVAVARRAFGLDQPVPPPDAPMPRHYPGLRILTIPDPFEALVWAILGQQINVAFAAKTKRALIERYGEVVEVGGRSYRLFPEPDRLAALTPEELRPLQISRQKGLYITGLARSGIDLEALRGRPDEEVVERLTRLKGIGRWTAEYLLVRGFGRPDVIAAGDMGIRAIAGRLYGLGRNATEAEVRELARAWAPWRGYAGFYLWFALQQRDV